MNQNKFNKKIETLVQTQVATPSFLKEDEQKFISKLIYYRLCYKSHIAFNTNK